MLQPLPITVDPECLVPQRLVPHQEVSYQAWHEGKGYAFALGS